MSGYDFDDRADYDMNGHVDDFEQSLYSLEMEDEDRQIASGKGVFNGTGFSRKERSRWQPTGWQIVGIILLIYSIIDAIVS